MAIAVASIVQESNDFSPLKTRYEDFGLVFEKDVLRRHDGVFTEMGGFLSVLSQARRKVEPLCSGWAVTAGRMLRADYQRLAHEYLQKLASVARPQGLLLALHGAQTAQSTDDVAGHLLNASRRILGPHCTDCRHTGSACQRNQAHGGERDHPGRLQDLSTYRPI